MRRVHFDAAKWRMIKSSGEDAVELIEIEEAVSMLQAALLGGQISHDEEKKSTVESALAILEEYSEKIEGLLTGNAKGTERCAAEVNGHVQKILAGFEPVEITFRAEAVSDGDLGGVRYARSTYKEDFLALQDALIKEALNIFSEDPIGDAGFDSKVVVEAIELAKVEVEGGARQEAATTPREEKTDEMTSVPTPLTASDERLHELVAYVREEQTKTSEEEEGEGKRTADFTVKIVDTGGVQELQVNKEYLKRRIGEGDRSRAWRCQGSSRGRWERL